MSVPLINGLEEIADQYDHFILDVWGVLHDGLQAFPGTIQCLQNLKQAGKGVVLLSNTPSLGGDIQEHLRSMGVVEELYEHIVTAGDSTRKALKRYEGQTCWFAARGEQFGKLVKGLDIKLIDTPEGADFVLNAIGGTGGEDEDPVFEELKRAADLGLPMICANPDLVVNVGESLYQCAGTYAAYYERVGGEVEYHGKPHAPVYEMCYELLGAPKKRSICAIGDSFHTDITGANGFGIECVMNLVGIHRDEVITDGRIDPSKMRAMLLAASTHPTYMMAGFEW